MTTGQLVSLIWERFVTFALQRENIKPRICTHCTVCIQEQIKPKICVQEHSYQLIKPKICVRVTI